MIQGHGGNIYDVARRLGCKPFEIIDMSSNVNPLGPPPGLKEHLKENIDSITALPEVDAKDIANKFAHRYDIDSECVITGFDHSSNKIWSSSATINPKIIPTIGKKGIIFSGSNFPDFHMGIIVINCIAAIRFFMVP